MSASVPSAWSNVRPARDVIRRPAQQSGFPLAPWSSSLPEKPSRTLYNQAFPTICAEIKSGVNFLFTPLFIWRELLFSLSLFFRAAICRKFPGKSCRGAYVYHLFPYVLHPFRFAAFIKRILPIRFRLSYYLKTLVKKTFTSACKNDAFPPSLALILQGLIYQQVNISNG